MVGRAASDPRADAGARRDRFRRRLGDDGGSLASWLGVKRDDISIMMLRDHGVDLYANAVFTTPAFARQRPDAVRRFVKATIQSWLNAAVDPDAAIASLKRAEPLSDPAVELGRLKWALEFVMTPQVQQSGIGKSIRRV